MFKIEFYDNLTRYMFSSWWMYLVLGFNCILLGVLILIFPSLLAYLIAIFLLASGVIFAVIAFSTKRIKKKYGKWKESHIIPIE